MGDLDAVGEGEDIGIGVLLDCVEVDRGGAGAYGVFEVLPGRTLISTELDELGAGGLEAPVVPVALSPLNQELALHAGGVRELFDLVVVIAGHHGRGGEREGGPGSRRYPSGGHINHLGNCPTGFVLQLRKGNVGDTSGLHRLPHFGHGR